MEIRLSNSKQNESLLIDEISKVKREYISQTAEFEKERTRMQNLEKQVETLTQSLADFQSKEVLPIYLIRL